MQRSSFAKISLLILILLGPLAWHSASQSPVPVEITVSKCWTSGDFALRRAAALDSETIFLGSGQGEVGAISAAGRKLWSSELGGRVSSNLIVSDNSLIAATSVVPGRGEESVDLLRSLSKLTGVTNWIAKLPAAAKYSLAIHNGDVIAIGSGGQVTAVDQKSGAVKWNRSFAPPTADPLFVRGKVVLAAEGAQLLTISLESGEIEATRKLPGNATAIVENALGQIVMGDDRGSVYLLNGTEKPVWRFKTGGAITRLYVVIDYIVAISNDNFVYHLLARNGDVDWKKRLSGRVAGAGVISDKWVVTQSLDDPSVVFTDLQTGKTAGQYFVEPGEALTSSVIHSGGSVFLMTDRAVHRVAVGSCAG